MHWCVNTSDPVSIKCLHWRNHSMKIDYHYVQKVINYPRIIVHKHETPCLGKNEITALDIFKKQGALWVANRASSESVFFVSEITSIRYYCVDPIHLWHPYLVIPSGKREHSLKPAPSYGVTDLLASTRPGAFIMHPDAAKQKQGWIRPNGGQVTWKNKHVFSLPSNHRISW